MPKGRVAAIVHHATIKKAFNEQLKECKDCGQVEFYNRVTKKYNNMLPKGHKEIGPGSAMRACLEMPDLKTDQVVKKPRGRQPGQKDTGPRKPRETKLAPTTEEEENEVVKGKDGYRSPSLSYIQILRGTYNFLKKYAVEDQWLSSFDEGWNLLNAIRKQINLRPLRPINHPTEKYFS
jgi:hypothetical protein